MRFLFALLACLAMAPLSGAAGTLVWPEKEVSRSVWADEADIAIRFHFRNEGDAPVHLRRLGASCSCTQVRADLDRVAPGQEGAVEAVIRTDAMPGRFTRRVFVQSDEGPDLLTLTVNLEVKAVLSFAPRLVWWMEGTAAEVREVKVTFGEAGAVEVLGLRSEHPGFKAEWSPEAGGGRVALRVDAGVRDTQTKVFVDYRRDGQLRSTYFLATVQ